MFRYHRCVKVPFEGLGALSRVCLDAYVCLGAYVCESALRRPRCLRCVLVPYECLSFSGVFRCLACV